jgi:hypothetical protein
MGVVFFLLGLLLLVLACLYVLPVEWRLYGLAGAALVTTGSADAAAMAAAPPTNWRLEIPSDISNLPLTLIWSS